MGKLFFLIGASGSGKTTIAKILELKGLLNLQICYFDSIGIPSTQKMIEEYGSIDEWQRVKTIEWTKRLKDDYLEAKNVVLDAQARPIFIEEACRKSNVKSYEIILFDCKDEIRKQRLVTRGNPELANDTMISWSKYLRKECISKNYKIIDTSELSIEQSVSKLLTIINNYNYSKRQN